MRLSTKCLLTLLAILPATFAWADDLALLKITSQSQADVATRLFGHAYVRSGNQFLVSLSASNRDSIIQLGLSAKVVMEDVSLRSACLVIPSNRGKMAGLDLSSLGEGVALEGGAYLQDGPSGAASAAKDRGEAYVIPLADKNVPFLYQPPPTTHLMAPNDFFPTDSVINKISLDTILAINQHLEGFQTRHIRAAANETARDWIISKFNAWGYTQITTPEFWYASTLCKNIQVVKLGYAEPDQIIVIGGHYDTYNTQSDPTVFAPGADDDGSGTTLTMEVARVLANVPLRKTVIFIPFSAEEEGLIGSNVAATAFRAAGAKIEAMLNYDMIGYTTDSYWDFSLSSGLNPAYAQLCTQTANRVTSLIPKTVTMGSSSDHYSFNQQGYDIVDNIESDFNTPGWHTNIDVTSRMNFPYMTQVVRMAAASLAQIANSATPSVVSKIVDVGDGSNLDVTISNCNSTYQYWLYWGRASGVYTDSVQMPPGWCTYRVGGLTTGTRYYFGVFGKPSDGYRAVWTNEQSEMPLVMPRSPQNLAAEPAEKQIDLDWSDNLEEDFGFYRVYRRPEAIGAYELLADNVMTSSFVDTQVVAGLKYYYKVTAVDQSFNESQKSVEVGTWPATFDGGILVVDEFTQDYDYMASEDHQAAYFDTILGFLPHALAHVDTVGANLDKGVAGRYSSIIWDDDDFFNKQISGNTAILSWYLSHTVNMLICGVGTIRHWSPTPVDPNNLLSKEFMVSAWYSDNFETLDTGRGANGWPSVQLDPNRGWAYGTDIPVLTVRSGGTVIMTYDAADNDPNFEGKPIGVAYSGPHGKRVLLSIPLYYLTPASATALVTKAKQFFGDTAFVVPAGDVNHSGLTDLADLSALVAYLTGSLPHFVDPNAADVNHSCFVDLADLSGLISYLTSGGPVLQHGCVTP